MPKLKCIGGMADGELAYTEFINEHDIVRVPAKITFELNSFEEELTAFREGRTPKNLANRYYMYKITALNYKDENGQKLKIYYLIPQNWHEWEALQHMFKCYG